MVTEPRSGGGFQHIPRPALVLGFAGLLPFLASALGVWAMLFLAITLIGASLALGKKLGALFRV